MKKKILVLMIATMLAISSLSFYGRAADTVVIDGIKTTFVGAFGRVSYGGKAYSSYKNLDDALSSLGNEGGRIIVQGTVNASEKMLKTDGDLIFEGVGTSSKGNTLLFPDSKISLHSNVSLKNICIDFPENGTINTAGYDLTAYNSGSTLKMVYDSELQKNINDYPVKVSVMVSGGSTVLLHGGRYGDIFCDDGVDADISISLSEVEADDIFATSEDPSFSHNGNVVITTKECIINGVFGIGDGEINGNLVMTSDDIGVFNKDGGSVKGKKVFFGAGKDFSEYFDICLEVNRGRLSPVFDGKKFLGFSGTDANGFSADSVIVDGAEMSATDGVVVIPDGQHAVTPCSPVKIGISAEANYVNGYSDGSFLPGNNITRAEAVTMLSRLIGDEKVFADYVKTELSDVGEGSWYYSYISLFDTLGYLDTLAEDGCFFPDSKITRGEFCELLSHLYALSSTRHLYPVEFFDVPDDYKYKTAVGKSGFLGVVTGYEDGSFRPDNLITRAEAVTMINRTIGRVPAQENLSAFSDTENHWAKAQIAAAASEKTKDGVNMWNITDTNRFGQYIKYRGSLTNTYNRLKNDKELNVAFIGGSVTAGSGASDMEKTSWRGRTVEWFKSRYPDCTINQVNAAIGDSYTKYAVYRMDTDLLKYDFDIVFIEYAINDSPWYSAKQDSETIIYFETLVRRIYEHNPKADIVITYTFDDKLDRTQEYFPTAAAQETIAVHYDIPSVNFGRALGNYIGDNNLNWSDYFKDYVHPVDSGYEYYISVLSEYLANALSDEMAKGETRDKQLPAQKAEKLWYNLTMLEAAEVDLSMSKNWALTDDGKYLYATDKDNELVIKTKGTDICIASKRANEMEYSVDGGARIYMKMNRTPQTLADNIEDGEHILRIYALNPSASLIQRVMYNG